jgi:serine protease AprX
MMYRVVRTVLIISFISVCFSLHGQIAPQTYWLSFTDKNNSAYSINRPNEFLSKRSLARRAIQNIGISESDLPVNQNYLDSLEHLGLKIHNVSKWLNGAAIISTDTALLDTLHKISFIKYPINQSGILSMKSALNKVFPDVNNDIFPDNSTDQLEMLNLPMLHQKGITGEGVLIGILDAGFSNATKIESLKHVWDNNKVLAVKDFVKDSTDIFNTHIHGTLVFSIIAANWPNNLTGSAPDADFLLIRTENGSSEYLVEEYNWISGAEYADSLGVDIINSSLGYFQFNDPSQNHTYENMDGQTAPVTIGAAIAVSKGILIVNSAGNEGDDSWYYMIAPADADSILSVGAVDINKNIARFSSHGPAYDGRTKPEVCAVGKGTAGQIASGSVYYCNGTSCSAPLITGLAACLRQAHPYSTSQDLRQAIIQSSSQYTSPDNSYGYGIPNAYIASTLLDTTQTLPNIKLFPNPTSNSVNITLNLPWLSESKKGYLSILDLNGSILYSYEITFNPDFNYIIVAETAQLQTGYYTIQAAIYGRFYSFPFIKVD